MNTESNFTKEPDEFFGIGKKLPYHEPDDFFDGFSEKMLKLSKQRNRDRNKRFLLLRSFAVAASLAAVIFLGFLIQNSDNSEEIVAVPENKVETVIISEQNKKNQVLPIDESVKNDVAENPASEIVSTENLNDVLADLSDDELMQLAAMYKADPFSEDDAKQ
jgi:hypothetical protein